MNMAQESSSEESKLAKNDTTQSTTTTKTTVAGGVKKYRANLLFSQGAEGVANFLAENNPLAQTAISYSIPFLWDVLGKLFPHGSADYTRAMNLEAVYGSSQDSCEFGKTHPLDLNKNPSEVFFL